MGTIASEIWRQRDTEVVGAQKTKLIQELTGNRNAKNLYADTIIPCTYEKVAADICKGVPIHY